MTDLSKPFWRRQGTDYLSSLNVSRTPRVITYISSLQPAEHGLYYVRPLLMSIYIFICVAWAPAFCGLVCVWSSDSEEVVLHHNCTFFKTSGLCEIYYKRIRMDGFHCGRDSDSTLGNALLQEHLSAPQCIEGAKNILLWKFILDQLRMENNDIIKWVDRSSGTFRFVDTLEISKKWGERKKKTDMNFEKLSRGIRYDLLKITVLNIYLINIKQKNKIGFKLKKYLATKCALLFPKALLQKWVHE
ncbi:hypothetical protein FSP39_004290 [Pinctada imbricata]|uniref:ETS domain-containing protein n=1 Tax=Pinctada imbricata TaxID=66713 RepID=A0AA89C6F8_PINIB|nr:hypothetical protein FSP39_004290 [Pinctada imbricata]